MSEGLKFETPQEETPKTAEQIEGQETAPLLGVAAEEIKNAASPEAAKIAYEKALLAFAESVRARGQEFGGDEFGNVETPEFKEYQKLQEVIMQRLGMKAETFKYLSGFEDDLVRFNRARESFGVSLITEVAAEQQEKAREAKFRGEGIKNEDLEAEGIKPVRAISIEEGDQKFEVLTSDPFTLPGDRIGIVGYVNDSAGYVARLYYRSNSQGAWRYLPDHKVNDEGKISWLGKGWSESSITVPVYLQKAFAEASTKEPIKLSDEDRIVRGLSSVFKLKDFSQNTYYSNTDSEPEILNENFSSDEGKVAPEKLVLVGDRAPVFISPLSSWREKNPLYGEVTQEVFPSQDNSLLYTFARDESGRVWVSSVENHSRIISTGTRKTYIDAGDLLTPGAEYAVQAGSYGGEPLSGGDAGSKYVDMYENYLSKSPAIRGYLEARPTIKDSTSFEKLYRAIEIGGPVKGSLKEYSVEELHDLITQYRNNEIDLRTIPSNGGLRSKVRILKILEKADANE